MGRSPHRHGGRSHERSQMHHQRIHRHHAIQVGNEVHLVPQLYLAVQCRHVRIECFHPAGEFGFLTAAAVDENPVETPAQQTDGFGAQLFGISLARLGGERRETDPYTLFFSHGIGSGAFLGRPGIGKVESQATEDVAITDDGVFQRFHTFRTASQPHVFLDPSLVNYRNGDPPQVECRTHHLRTQYVVHVGHRVDLQLGRFAGEPNGTPDTPVRAAGFDIQKTDIQPFEKGMEQRFGRNGHLHLGIRLLQGAERMGQHRHIAHRRSTDHEQVPGQLFIFSRHKARD